MNRQARQREEAPAAEAGLGLRGAGQDPRRELRQAHSRVPSDWTLRHQL